jgi:lysophospholipid acyltransferase
MRQEDEYNNINWKKCNISALQNLFWAFVCAFILVMWADSTDPLYTATEEFANKSFIYKYFYVYFSIIVTRSRYYVGWKLCQGSVDFCGLGYTERVNKDGMKEYSFDKIDVCNLYVMEFSINPKTKLQYWNRSVHLWLKYHLYLRMINTQYFAKNKGLASLITFSVSAVWHGFYPSYYLFFLQFYLIEQITSYLEEKYDFFNKIDKSNFITKFIAWNIVMNNLIYFGNTFPLLKLSLIYNYYKSFNFVPNLILLTAFMYVTVMRKLGKKNKINKIEENLKSN